MKVVHFNIRLSEGGAARVGVELHMSLLDKGLQSVYAYGYSKHGGGSELHNDKEGHIKLMSRSRALFNLIAHNLIGIDLIKPTRRGIEKITEIISDSDIVHLHAIHSHYLPFKWFFELLKEHAKAIVWTHHDHWAVTGRCAFLDNCPEWELKCGNCVSNKNYPPSMLDFSLLQRREKIEAISSIIPKTIFVSPSIHLGEDLKKVYPSAVIRTVPNSLDKEFFLLSDNFQLKRQGQQVTILVIANDLSYKAKTNPELVNKIISSGYANVVTVGKNSPFSGEKVTNYGAVDCRQSLIDIMLDCHAMLFSSVIDNFPLVIGECHSLGIPVLATPSPASDELLELVGGSSMSETEILKAIKSKLLFDHYCNINSRDALRENARSVLAPDKMSEKYIGIYNEFT